MDKEQLRKRIEELEEKADGHPRQDCYHDICRKISRLTRLYDDLYGE